MKKTIIVKQSKDSEEKLFCKNCGSVLSKPGRYGLFCNKACLEDYESKYHPEPIFRKNDYMTLPYKSYQTI